MFYLDFYQEVECIHKRYISSKNPLMAHKKKIMIMVNGDNRRSPGLYTWKINLPITYATKMATILDYSRICWTEEG